jgi:hypothetical protein
MWYFVIKLSVLAYVVYTYISCNIFVLIKPHDKLFFQILCYYFDKYKVIISLNLNKRLKFGLSLIGHQKIWEILSSDEEECLAYPNIQILF